MYVDKACLGHDINRKMNNQTMLSVKDPTCVFHSLLTLCFGENELQFPEYCKSLHSDTKYVPVSWLE